MTLDDMIARHCEIGKVNVPHVGAVNLLSCNKCGCFIWDVEKHMQYAHGVSLEG